MTLRRKSFLLASLVVGAVLFADEGMRVLQPLHISKGADHSSGNEEGRKAIPPAFKAPPVAAAAHTTPPKMDERALMNIVSGLNAEQILKVYNELTRPTTSTFVPSSPWDSSRKNTEEIEKEPSRSQNRELIPLIETKLVNLKDHPDQWARAESIIQGAKKEAAKKAPN